MADSVFLGSVYATAELRTEGFEEGRQKINDSLDSLDTQTKSKLASMGQAFTKLGGILSVAVTAPLALFGKSAVDTAVQIEQQWKEVQKVYGSTAGAFQRDSQMLTDAVESITIKFGLQRQETLSALSAIAAIGYEGPKAVDMLRQSVEFATTGQLGLNEAMEDVVAISKVYNVEGDKLRETLALLNTVENSTGASMQDLGTAVRIVGSSGKVAGVEIGELAGLIATLRERAVPATEAADGLKSIFTRIYKVTEDAQAVYNKYNITIKETETVTGKYTQTVGANADEVKRLSKMVESLKDQQSDYANKIKGVNMSDDERKKKVDELGKSIAATTAQLEKNKGVTTQVTGTHTVMTDKFKDADVILRELASHWKDMSDAEKFEVIQSNAMLYQKDKFVILMEDLSQKNSTYVKTLDAIANSTQNVTTYEKEMAVFLETSKVKLAQNKAQWDALKVAIGNILLEAILPISVKLAEVAKWFTTLDPSIQKVIVGIGLLAAAVGPLLLGLGALIQSITAIGTILTAGSIAGVALAGAFGLIAGAIAAVGIAIVLHNPQLQELWSKTEAVKAATDRLKTAQNELENSMNTAKNAELQLTQAKLNEIATQKNQEEATKRFEELVRTKADPTTRTYKEAELQMTEAKQLHEQAVDKVKDAEQRVIEKYTEANAKADEVLVKQKQLQEENKKTENSWQRIADAIGNAISKASEWVRNNWYGGVLDKIGRNAMGTTNWSGGWSMVGERGPELVYLPQGADVIPNHRIDQYMGTPIIQPTPQAAPQFSFYIGTFIGTETEKRQLAYELNRAYQDYRKGLGEIE